MQTNLFDIGNKAVRETIPYQAGKPIEEVEHELGISNIIKLASNENPLGPSPKAIMAIANSLHELHLYPDAAYFRLRQSLSGYTGVAIDQITVGNGSENCLEILMKAYLDNSTNVIVDQYCFATIRILIKAYGSKEVLIPSANYRHNVTATLAKINIHTKMIVVVNPNNPTGTYIGEQDLVYLLDNVPANILVVVDEAYYEYAVNQPDYPDTVKLMIKYPNLIISRTFSKVYGLAGLRVGYLLSSLSVAQLLHRSRLPFNVNSCAVSGAIAAIADHEFLAATCKVNSEGLAQLSAGFSELGIKYIPSVANFITIDLEYPAGETYQQLLRAGIIVRPLVPYDLPNHLRITVGTYEQNRRLLIILGEIYHA